MSYIGHGGIHLWVDENIFNTSDVASLAPQPKQPLLLTMNCLNGYFHFPYFDSLAEELLKADGKGDIAAFSPGGLSLNAPAHLFHQALLDELFHGAHQRLGDAVLAAQGDYAATGAFPELLSIYHLLGDPALLLRRSGGLTAPCPRSLLDLPRASPARGALSRAATTQVGHGPRPTSSKRQGLARYSTRRNGAGEDLRPRSEGSVSERRQFEDER